MSRCILFHFKLLLSQPHLRCPDALLCESVFDQVLKEVSPSKMDLSLIYVARYPPVIKANDILTEYFHYSD